MINFINTCSISEKEYNILFFYAALTIGYALSNFHTASTKNNTP